MLFSNKLLSMKKVTTALLLLSIYIISTISLKSAETLHSNSSISLFGSYRYGINKADFSIYENLGQKDISFNDGHIHGYFIGIGYDYTVLKNFRIGFETGYVNTKHSFLEKEYTVVNTEGDLERGEFNYEVNNQNHSLIFAPKLIYRGVFPLEVSLGYSMKVHLSNDLTSVKKIINPDWATFVDENENNTHKRIITDKINAEANPIYSEITLCIGYSLPLNNKNTLFLKPKLSFGYNLSYLYQKYLWNTYTISAGVQISWDIPRTKEKPKEIIPEKPDTLIREKLAHKSKTGKKTSNQYSTESQTNVDEKQNSDIAKDTIQERVKTKIDQNIETNETDTTISKSTEIKDNGYSKSDTLKSTASDKSGYNDKDIPNISDNFERKDTSKQNNQVLGAKDTIYDKKADDTNRKEIDKNIMNEPITKDTNSDNQEKDKTVSRTIDIQRHYIPIINRIYFEDNSAEVKHYYLSTIRKEINKNVGTILSFLLQCHYSILDTLAKRVKISNSTIRLTGIYLSDNGDSKDLALKRTKNLENVLINQYNLDSSKISTAIDLMRNSGKKPIDEYNYVEITFDSDEILKPMICKKKIPTRSVNPLSDAVFYLFFDFDKAEPLPNSVVSILPKIDRKKYQLLNIIGYTDKYGDPNYNIKLSSQRALSVAKQLEDFNESEGLGVLSENIKNYLPESKILSRVVLVNVKDSSEN